MFAHDVENLFVGHVNIDGNNVVPVCHDGADASVAQREDTVYNFLFHLLHLSAFRSFVNHRLDFLFRNLFVSGVNVQDIEYDGGTFRQ